jgi:phage baseplate assembly protein gpV
MTDELINSIKRHVSGMIGQIGQARFGTISSVNVATYEARVMIQPENVMSGWLPIAATMVGAGWGLVSPPTVGEQVIVSPTEGDSEHSIITGRIFSTQQQPPKTYTDQTQQGTTTNIQPGEIGLVHQSGTFLRLMAGKVLINGDLFVNGQVHATGNVISDMIVTGTVAVTDSHGTLDRLRQNYDAHVHPFNGRPVPQDPE